MVIKCVIFSVLLSRSRCGVQSLLFGTDDYARCVDRTEGTMVRKSVIFSWFHVSVGVVVVSLLVGTLCV